MGWWGSKQQKQNNLRRSKLPKFVNISKKNIPNLYKFVQKFDNFLGSKYLVKGQQNWTTAGEGKAEEIIHGISDSNIHEEFYKVYNGFKLDFEDNKTPGEQMQRPLGTSKLKKAKRKAGKKRILRRIYHESVNDQSGYSSLVSSYVDISGEISIMSLQGIEEVDEGEDNEIIYQNDIEENKNTFEHKPRNLETSEPSLPAEEHFDSLNNLELNRNSPRMSKKVFDQEGSIDQVDSEDSNSENEEEGEEGEEAEENFSDEDSESQQEESEEESS